eukprot:438979-Rhodomonas_salina.3
MVSEHATCRIASAGIRYLSTPHRTYRPPRAIAAATSAQPRHHRWLLVPTHAMSVPCSAYRARRLIAAAVPGARIRRRAPARSQPASGQYTLS